MPQLPLNSTLFASTSTRNCPVCHRTVILCQCLRNRHQIFLHDEEGYLRLRSPLQDDVLLGGVLDIEDIEAQPTDYNDLELAAPLCEKRHRHSEFIHVDDFTISHLPEAIRHAAMYVWVRHCAPLVVRLLSNVSATGRACLIPQDIGKTLICDDVHCPHIQRMGPEHLLYGGIGIITNKHVVRNDNHAATTRVEFFYNNSELDAVFRELGTTVHSTNRKMDYTLFRCYVHSKDIITNIAIFDKLRDYCWLQIPQDIRNLARDYAIVISHPHSSSKKISIGRVIEREIKQNRGRAQENAQLLRRIYDLCEQNNALTRFEMYFSLCPDIELPISVTWYDTPTCKGSSGAPVFMGNVVLENGQEINQAHTHRGVDNNKGYNNCFT